jgi:choline dehydrogenase
VDVIIVGDGTSGAVLAARLSEDPGRSVLLLEQGPDDTAYDASVLSPERAGDVWGGTPFAEPFPMRSGGRDVAMVRGRVLGGTSAVNYLATMRGQPSDYDNWAALGLDGWGWADVLDTFKAVERDLDFGRTELHGADGPLTVRRSTRAQQAFCHTAFHDGLREMGVAAVEDVNDPAQLPGVGIFPLTVHQDERLTVSRAYLTDEVRARPNLTILTGVTVSRVLVAPGPRVVGVEVLNGESFVSNEVIVSCGAVGSPALLQRSGIGPKGILDPLGIEVKVNLPGVGSSLQDHLGPPLLYRHDGPSGLAGGPVQPVWVGRTPDSDEPVDFHVFSLPVGDTAGAETFFSVVPFLLDVGGRGTVYITSTDPEVAPEVVMPGLDEQDLERLRWIVGRLAEWERTEAFAALGAERVLPAGELSETVLSEVISYGHLGSTCAMGRVLDAQCRVRGLRGLRVVDASSMPVLPAGNTYLGCVMVAERVASMLR